ncbi:MAG: EamA family transporter RarD [Desulfobacterales bacterium]|jgi:chloramphenicol-sensitive protein RarD|nr:EamA family transporter RarD [Desulfobacterales bacterium]
MTSNVEKSKSDTVWGVLYATPAFLIWGISPIYWKALRVVPALEIILHRMVWSFFFLVPLVVIMRRWQEFKDALKNYRTLLILLFTAFIVGGNWLLYIWAVNNDYLLQASLGYYINPLVNVVLGMVFLKERLRPPQIVAVLLAAAGVLYLTIYYGELPWIALALAVSFGLYGLIRKIAPVGSLVGLTVETLLLSIPALVYLFYLDSQGAGSFLRVSLKLDLLLMGCSLVTAIPLLFFTLGARRLYLSTVGLLQYIAPSCMFVLAVFLFREPFSMAQVVTFVFIWTALAIYSTDSLRYYKRAEQNPSKNSVEKN